MLGLIIRWVLFALALFFVEWVIPGISFTSFMSAMFAVVVIGFVNIFIRPVFILLTLPLNILTLGLFTLIINALMFWFVSAIVPGFKIDGFLDALIGSLVLSLLSFFINKVDV